MTLKSNSISPIDLIHILIRTTHSIQKEFSAQLATMDIPVKISGPRLRILSTVAECGSIRMKDLADKLGIQARTVTDFIDALEKEQLLIRCADPSDRRVTRIELTELAKTHLDAALEQQSLIANSILSTLTSEQQAQLHELLLALHANKPLSSDLTSI